MNEAHFQANRARIHTALLSLNADESVPKAEVMLSLKEIAESASIMYREHECALEQTSANPIAERLFIMSMELVKIARANDPIAFRGALGGVIANVVGHLSEEYFEKMASLEPCGLEGCDCHLTVGKHTSEFLTMLRGDWQKAIAMQENATNKKEA